VSRTEAVLTSLIFTLPNSVAALGAAWSTWERSGKKAVAAIVPAAVSKFRRVSIGFNLLPKKHLVWLCGCYFSGLWNGCHHFFWVETEMQTIRQDCEKKRAGRGAANDLMSWKGPARETFHNILRFLFGGVRTKRLRGQDIFCQQRFGVVLQADEPCFWAQEAGRQVERGG
jgi:hypothetical protein